MNASSYWGSHTGREIRDMQAHSLRFHAEEYRRTHRVTEYHRECFKCGHKETVTIDDPKAHDGVRWLDWNCAKCGAKKGQS